jgi:hypothetical protein
MMYSLTQHHCEIHPAEHMHHCEIHPPEQMHHCEIHPAEHMHHYEIHPAEHMIRYNLISFTTHFIFNFKGFNRELERFISFSTYMTCEYSVTSLLVHANWTQPSKCLCHCSVHYRNIILDTIHCQEYIVMCYGWVVWLITRRGSDWILDLFAMEITTTNSGYTGYNYNDHFSTVSFSNPTDRIALHWHLTSRTDWRRLTSEADWLTLVPKTDWLVLSVVFPI